MKQPETEENQLAKRPPLIAESEPPVPGMKTMPVGLELPLMDMFWASCVSATLSQPDAVSAFKEETGHDLDAIASARGIAAMIDKATGRTDAAFVAWCDWVTENVWGSS